jgi:hypothetical protein
MSPAKRRKKNSSYSSQLSVLSFQFMFLSQMEGRVSVACVVSFAPTPAFVYLPLVFVLSFPLNHNLKSQSKTEN